MPPPHAYLAHFAGSPSSASSMSTRGGRNVRQLLVLQNHRLRTQLKVKVLPHGDANCARPFHESGAIHA